MHPLICIAIVCCVLPFLSVRGQNLYCHYPLHPCYVMIVGLPSIVVFVLKISPAFLFWKFFLAVSFYLSYTRCFITRWCFGRFPKLKYSPIMCNFRPPFSYAAVRVIKFPLNYQPLQWLKLWLGVVGYSRSFTEQIPHSGTSSSEKRPWYCCLFIASWCFIYVRIYGIYGWLHKMLSS